VAAQPAERPRPRGQAIGQSPAREDAGAPLRRHWYHAIRKSESALRVFARRPDAIHPRSTL